MSRYELNMNIHTLAMPVGSLTSSFELMLPYSASPWPGEEIVQQLVGRLPWEHN